MRIDVAMTSKYVNSYNAIQDENWIYITASGTAVIEHDMEHPKMWCMSGCINKATNKYEWNIRHSTSIPEDGIVYIAYHLYERTVNAEDPEWVD